jgi:uncharacterized protein YndB with AHSA1/START domain
MTSGNGSAAELEQRTLLLDRLFDAPRDVVFKAWSEPEHLIRWWGPRGFTSDIEKMEFRVGGAYRIHMRSPEGTDHWSQGVYREIVPPERLVMVGSWADALGNPTTPETVLTVTFEERGARTRLTLHSVFETVTARDSHRGGWSSSLERLVEYLAAT